jgi:hypothetical protein
MNQRYSLRAEMGCNRAKIVNEERSYSRPKAYTNKKVEKAINSEDPVCPILWKACPIFSFTELAISFFLIF